MNEDLFKKIKREMMEKLRKSKLQAPRKAVGDAACGARQQGDDLDLLSGADLFID